MNKIKKFISWLAVGIFAFLMILGIYSKSPLAMISSLLGVVVCAPVELTRNAAQKLGMRSVGLATVFSVVLFFVTFFGLGIAIEKSEKKPNLHNAEKLALNSSKEQIKDKDGASQNIHSNIRAAILALEKGYSEPALNLKQSDYTGNDRRRLIFLVAAALQHNGSEFGQSLKKPIDPVAELQKAQITALEGISKDYCSSNIQECYPVAREDIEKKEGEFSQEFCSTFPLTCKRWNDEKKATIFRPYAECLASRRILKMKTISGSLNADEEEKLHSICARHAEEQCSNIRFERAEMCLDYRQRRDHLLKISDENPEKANSPSVARKVDTGENEYLRLIQKIRGPKESWPADDVFQGDAGVMMNKRLDTECSVFAARKQRYQRILPESPADEMRIRDPKTYVVLMKEYAEARATYLQAETAYTRCEKLVKLEVADLFHYDVTERKTEFESMFGK
jgi:hypothetical protein